MECDECLSLSWADVISSSLCKHWIIRQEEGRWVSSRCELETKLQSLSSSAREQQASLIFVFFSSLRLYMTNSFDVMTMSTSIEYVIDIRYQYIILEVGSFCESHYNFFLDFIIDFFSSTLNIDQNKQMWTLFFVRSFVATSLISRGWEIFSIKILCTQDFASGAATTRQCCSKL